MDDLISRRAATSMPILSKEHRKIFKSIDDAFETGWNEALSCVNMLPSVQPERKKDEWIPISKETNPTKSGWYLVTVHEDATNDNERFTGIAEFDAINGMWYDIDEPTDVYLRWMPLPAPYRGGEE